MSGGTSKDGSGPSDSTAASDADGAVVGTVTAVENFGASDLLEIKPPAGKKFFLPFVDDYVGEVDLDAGTVTVEIPEGLLE